MKSKGTAHPRLPFFVAKWTAFHYAKSPMLKAWIAQYPYKRDIPCAVKYKASVVNGTPPGFVLVKLFDLDSDQQYTVCVPRDQVWATARHLTHPVLLDDLEAFNTLMKRSKNAMGHNVPFTF